MFCFSLIWICYGKRRKSLTPSTIITWTCTKTSAIRTSAIIHLPYWQNMLLRTKRKISWRIQSGRSYDLTFPSRYAMRKLGSFKWFFIAYLEHIDAIIDSPPHCLHKTTFPLFLGITISSQGKNNLRCTSFMKDQLRRDISLWGANDILVIAMPE